MTTTCAPGTRTTHAVEPRRHLCSSLVGGFFLVMGGVHLGLISTDAQVYRHFADHALLGSVSTGWSEIFMAAPVIFGGLLMAGEVVVGILLLAGGPFARAGWSLAVAFHVLLLLFGWWAWVWAVPAGALLVLLAKRDLAEGQGR